MGRKRKEVRKRKEKLTIRLRKEVIDELRKIKNYNSLIERLLDEYVKFDCSSDKEDK